MPQSVAVKPLMTKDAYNRTQKKGKHRRTKTQKLMIRAERWRVRQKEFVAGEMK